MNEAEQPLAATAGPRSYGAGAVRFVARLRLLGSVPVSATETAVAAGLLALAGAAAYGSHVVHGGFLHDDWSYLADAKFAGSFGDAADANRVSAGGRILNAYYLAFTQRTFGTHMHVQLLWLTFLAVLMSFALYLVIRNVGVARLHAAAVAGLTLVFPATAPSRLWITAGVGQLVISLYLLGVLVALRGLRERGRRAVALHAGAIALWVTSMLIYEICAVAVLATVLLYRLRAPWRAALVRWPFSIAAVGLTLAYMNSKRTQVVHSLHDEIEHARLIFAQARGLLLSLGIPNGEQRLETWIVAAIPLLAGVVWLALPRESPTRSQIRYWLAFALAGVLVLGAGYAMFVPADFYYSPLNPGLPGRMNIVAAAGYVLVLYALIALVGTIVFRGLRHGAELWLGFLVVGTVLLAVVFVRQMNREVAVYNHSWALQDGVLKVLRDQVSRPPPGTTLYAFGSPPDAAAGVPVFGASWDMTGAIRVLWNEDELSAIPDRTLTAVACSPDGVVPSGPLYVQTTTPYGTVLFADSATGRSAPVRDLASCERLLPTFTSLPATPPE